MSDMISTIPSSPSSVLDFWFGPSTFNNLEAMRSPSLIPNRLPLWFGFKSDFSRPLNQEEQLAVDNSAKQFIPLIRTCGLGKIRSNDTLWNTDSGLYAQMLLCDQLPRNAFRGEAEAFAYDSKGVSIARAIYDAKMYESYGAISYFTFFLTPGQHSEEAEDHEMNVDLVDFVRTKFGGNGKEEDDRIEMLESNVMGHKIVIDRFGRYPHRNEALGRESTDEEKVWLADIENLPAWARSQMK
jgi:uncharacterized protein (DUF924 family)